MVQLDRAGERPIDNTTSSLAESIVRRLLCSISVLKLLWQEDFNSGQNREERKSHVSNSVHFMCIGMVLITGFLEKNELL